jgi:Carboxypeptidase regulatory-like domain
MVLMRKPWVWLLLVAAVVICAWALPAAAQDDDGPTSSLHFVVVRDYNGKPVRNAAVVMHPVNSKGKQARGGLELKTDVDGKTEFDGVPYGPLRVQVLATGFQTFGEDYDISKPEMEIVVKLKRPQGQYSIYEKHPEDKKTEAPLAKSPEAKPDSKSETKPQ